MKVAIVIGSNSDIMKALTPMLEADGYEVTGWHTGQKVVWPRWDLAIIALGKVAPVGLWHDVNVVHWYECIYSNLTAPFEKLRSIWSKRNLVDSTVIWFAGSNPQKIMAGYSAYNTSKMAVLKLIEHLDAETPNCKFVALGPGYVKTKIHEATLKAKWPNERIERGDEASMEDIYKTMMWCISQPKEVVGGRNICVSDISKRTYTDSLVSALENDQETFKLRRRELRTFDGLG